MWRLAEYIDDMNEEECGIYESANKRSNYKEK
jgi:hypothetical protein